MQKFKLSDGRTVDLSFERHIGEYFTGSEDYFTGSIIDETKQETPKQVRNTENKTNKKDDMKTLLAYLLNHEFFFNAINEEFIEKWKPLIDNDMLYVNES